MATAIINSITVKAARRGTIDVEARPANTCLIGARQGPADFSDLSDIVTFPWLNRPKMAILMLQYRRKPAPT